MKSQKRVLVVCRGTYRGVQILESEGKFIIYLGVGRYEFIRLSDATKFVDEWIDLKKN